MVGLEVGLNFVEDVGRIELVWRDIDEEGLHGLGVCLDLEEAIAIRVGPLSEAAPCPCQLRRGRRNRGRVWTGFMVVPVVFVVVGGVCSRGLSVRAAR